MTPFLTGIGRSAVHTLLAAGLVAALAGGQTSATTPEFERCVLNAIGNPERRPELVIREIANHGAALLPREFELAVTGELEVQATADRVLRLPLTDELRQILVAAAARAPHAEVARFLQTLSRRDATDRECVVALGLLALAGDVRDLDLLERFGSMHASSAGVPPRVREAFGVALASILARHPQAQREVWKLYREVNSALAEAVVRAADSIPSEQGLAVLTGLLGARPNFDGIVLAHVADVARTLSDGAPEEAQRVVRAFLRQPNAVLFPVACEALVALEDVASIPALIELLDGDQAGANCALGALQKLSRKSVGRVPLRWSRWYQLELERWQSAESAVDDLRSDDRVAVVAELLALGRARLFRHEAAAHAIAGLRRSEVELVTLTCQILGELGSGKGEPALVEADAHPDASVRAAAAAALARIRAGRENRSRGSAQ